MKLLRDRMLVRARVGWAGRSDTTAVPIFAADVRSAVTEAECLKLAELARGRRVLELGSYLGRSTIALASTADVVHSVDVHPPEDVPNGAATTVTAFLANLDRYELRQKVVVHLGYSQLVLPEFLPASFDLVFIDAQHERDAVEEDLAAARRLVRPGGTIAFHDYGLAGVDVAGTWHAFGVTEVVDSFAAELGTAVTAVETLALVQIPR